jgi:succinate dehydrogenase/fumarate reductase flavoprotein subunit
MGGLSEGKIREEISHLNFFMEKKRDGVRPFVIMKELRGMMDQYVGPNRNEKGLKIALNKVLDLKLNALPNVQVGNERIFNLDWSMAIEAARALDLAEIVIRSAMFRKETRGHHYRSDFPRTLENSEHTLTKNRGGKIVLNYVPVNRLR